MLSGYSLNSNSHSWRKLCLVETIVLNTKQLGHQIKVDMVQVRKDVKFVIFSCIGMVCFVLAVGCD